MAIGDYEDPLDVAKRGKAAAFQSTGSYLPAVNQVSNPRNTAFARNAPINTIAQNYRTANQIPIGAIGTSFGYRSQPMNFGSFTKWRTNQQPTLTYHWRAGSGGVQGGNDAAADVTWSNGTTGTDAWRGERFPTRNESTRSSTSISSSTSAISNYCRWEHEFQRSRWFNGRCT
jgi:hypothetical protein